MSSDEQLELALTYAETWGGTSRVLAFRRLTELLVAERGGQAEALVDRALVMLERLRDEIDAADQEAAFRLARTEWPDPRLLAALGHAEPVSASGDPAIEDGASQIQTLLARLHAYRNGESDSAEAQLTRLAGDWRWECDERGRLTWLDGPAPAEIEGSSLFDLDGAVEFWERFSRRAPFREASVTIDGVGCRLSGVPRFDREGRFVGYRGIAQGEGGGRLAGDDLAKVAHEVRSPLNAIMGFAQIIENETLGPAPELHRREARRILDQATRVLAALDDLTDVARLDQGLRVTGGAADVATLLTRVAARYMPVAEARGAGLVLSQPGTAGTACTEPRLLERALSRLTAAALSVAAADETLLLGARRRDGLVELSLTRPAALEGVSEERLMDVAADAAPEIPPIGLSFGLRLVHRLAEAMGGTFGIEAQRFTLMLPLAPSDQQGVANGGENA